MSRRQQPCRNFLSGHCRFGANCRFSHDSQIQNQSNGTTNPFGFGSQKQNTQTSQQQQQHKPNPFGFGVQNTNSVNAFGNKWTSSSSSSAKQHETQTQPSSVHTCSDPEACKKIIIEDSKNEAPLWKLTCYGHAKNGACDVSGDVSCEELRALAYEESKQGRTLQSIVERERHLLQSKLAEFENLIRNPFVLKKNASFGNASPTVTTFSQLGAAPASFGQSNSLFQNLSAAQPQTKFGFGTSIGPVGSQMTNQNHSAFGSSIQQPTTANVSNFTFGRPPLNANANANQQQSSFLHSTSTINSNASKQQQSLSLGFGFLAAPPPSNLDARPPLDKREDTANDVIWSKEKWSIGEIPEEAPPVRYC